MDSEGKEINFAADSEVSIVESDTGTGRDRRPPAIVTVAGPLCFAGDLIAFRESLPEPKVGDRVVIHDAGANTIALYSRHCSRQAPPVYVFASQGQEGQEQRVSVVCVKQIESEDAVLEFWG